MSIKELTDGVNLSIDDEEDDDSDDIDIEFINGLETILVIPEVNSITFHSRNIDLFCLLKSSSTCCFLLIVVDNNDNLYTMTLSKFVPLRFVCENHFPYCVSEIRFIATQYSGRNYINAMKNPRNKIFSISFHFIPHPSMNQLNTTTLFTNHI